MDTEYIIVQAGGKGSRMQYLTANKPKSLVPVRNLPMLFHLFRKYPDRKFIIIGDYKYEVMRRYLAAFAEVRYLLVDARGRSGTCAGLSSALRLVPEGKAFLLIWSDLILPEDFSIPEEEGDYVGLSGDFRCRWKFENGVFEEAPSVERGVAGLFVFHDKSVIADVPEEGEFVRWLKDKEMLPKELLLSKTKEYGLIEEYNKLEKQRCRPFNRMYVEGDRIRKEGIDAQGRQLAVREKGWYRSMEELFSKNQVPEAFRRSIPKIYSYEPFVMERVDGENIYAYKALPLEEKKEILGKIIGMLRTLHGLGGQAADYFSMKEAYLTKTVSRLSRIRDLVPFADKRRITVNGRSCRNVFFYLEELERMVNRLPVKSFAVLHGDCTFSNMMLRGGREPVMIDPRGYFGHTELYGDPAYDWAKLYYSVVGNYDQFNLKNFRLAIDGEKEEVALTIESNGFEACEEEFFRLLEGEVDREQIQLIHAVIWLSLTTYAWEDYDSICGAFYNGIYYLEECGYDQLF